MVERSRRVEIAVKVTCRRSGSKIKSRRNNSCTDGGSSSSSLVVEAVAAVVVIVVAHFLVREGLFISALAVLPQACRGVVTDERCHPPPSVCVEALHDIREPNVLIGASCGSSPRPGARWSQHLSTKVHAKTSEHSHWP